MHRDLKAALVSIVIALILTPIVYQIVMAPMGWWMK